MIKYIHILAVLLSLVFAPKWSVGQMVTAGDASASATQCGCFEITDSVQNQVGGIYENTAIDITSPFNLKFTVNFGDDNFGGDGLTFSLQTGGSFSLGNGQWGLGIEGVGTVANPEVHVEFDTRYSHIECGCANNDNGVDHLGLMKNGAILHSLGGNPDDLWGMTMPGTLHPLIGGVSNIEDGLDHKVEIDYDGVGTLTVIVDGTPQIFPVNLAAELAPHTTAKWGWTGATPSAQSISNQQTVCLANCNEIDYSLVNCQNTVMDFTSNSFSFYPIVDYNWWFDPPGGTGPVNGQTVQHTFTTPGTHIVVVQSEDANGCIGTDTLEIGVGFEIIASADQDTVCPGEQVNLESEAVFYVPPSCDYTLMMGDLFCDGWAGSELNIYVNGTNIGPFSPPNVGCGGAGWEEFVDLSLPDGAEVIVEFVYAGVFGSEIYYTLGGPGAGGLPTIIDVTAGSVNGNISDTFYVDCGITATTYSYQWEEISTPQLNPPGPAAANWSNVTVDFPSAEFEIEITNNQTGCVVVDTVTVMTYDTASVIVTGDATICAGDCADVTFTFTGSPPYDLVYNDPVNGQQSVNGITSNPLVIPICGGGVVTPVSITANACPGNVYGSVNITEIPLPNVSIGASATYCQGDNMADLVANSNNGGSIFWFDFQPVSASDTLNAIGQGTTFDPNGIITTTTTVYAQEYSIPNGCSGSFDNVVITILPIPVAPNVTGQTVYCEGDAYSALTVSPAPSGTIIWTDGTQQVDTGLSFIPPSLNLGLNVFYAKEDNGTCFGDSTAITITLNPTPAAPGISGDTAYCTGDVPTALTATSGIGGIITWSDGSTGTTLIPALLVGQVTYCANETLNGCTGPDSCILVTTFEDPTITVPPSVSICIGDSVEICAENNGIFPPDQITWDHGPTTECVFLGPPADEQYTVCLTNPACGTACDTINVIVFDLPVVTAGDDQTTGLGGEVTMWADGAIDYSWSPSVDCQNSNCSSVYAVPSQTTYYVATGTDENGCVNTDTVRITIDGEMQVFIPNVFSPNGDGNNDIVTVMGPRLSNFEFKIFDRWGRKLFETTDQKQGWDGTFNGDLIPQQVVTYVVTGVDVLNRSVKRGGNIMIAR